MDSYLFIFEEGTLESKHRYTYVRKNQLSTLGFRTNKNTIHPHCLQTGVQTSVVIGPCCLCSSWSVLSLDKDCNLLKLADWPFNPAFDRLLSIRVAL